MNATIDSEVIEGGSKPFILVTASFWLSIAILIAVGAITGVSYIYSTSAVSKLRQKRRNLQTDSVSVDIGLNRNDAQLNARFVQVESSPNSNSSNAQVQKAREIIKLNLENISKKLELLKLEYEGEVKERQRNRGNQPVPKQPQIVDAAN